MLGLLATLLLALSPGHHEPRCLALCVPEAGIAACDVDDCRTECDAQP